MSVWRLGHMRGVRSQDSAFMCCDYTRPYFLKANFVRLDSPINIGRSAEVPYCFASKQCIRPILQSTGVRIQHLSPRMRTIAHLAYLINVSMLGNVANLLTHLNFYNNYNS